MQLWPHQISTVQKFLSTDIGNDFSDPGTGKTLSQLATYVLSPNPQRCLVICPKMLMTCAWGAQIDEFFPELTYSLAYAGQREEAFAANTDIVIANTDAVSQIDPKWLKNFNRLIVDESTAFKHPSTKRSKAIKKLSALFQYKFMLTGTPNSNSVTELWHPQYLLDRGARLGSTFHAFRNSVQYPEQVGPMPNHIKWRDKPGVEELVYKLISDITVRHAFEDVMANVPANHTATYSFTLNTKMDAYYRQLERDAILSVNDGNISAVHAASLKQKLLQVASGAVYNDAGSYSVLDNQRYEIITELVSQYKHCVVFFNWRHQRDGLAKLFDSAGYSFSILDGSTSRTDRDDAVTAFQNGQLRVLLMHPKTGAHGLTLTRGEACIITSPFYEADLLKQAVHRIYRGGQDKATNTVLVQATGTIDEYAYKVLAQKTLRMEDFLDYVAHKGVS